MQGRKLYVGNLSYSVTNEQLAELFAAYGQVRSVNIIEGKGFGFVEMSDSSEAEKAKEALHDTEFVGRTMKVDEARPPKSRPQGGRPQGGGGGRRGFQQGGGGGGDRRQNRGGGGSGGSRNRY
ncbi:MAG: RNA-binding protein [Anaerolineae bacterium]|nr:RNA-binding protein [Anaerolineae bacterium]